MSFVLDSFTAVNGTLLQQHVGEIGATWAKQTFNTPSEDLVINNGRVHKTANGEAFYLASGVHSNTSYTAEMVIRKTNTTYATGATCCLIVRSEDDADNFWVFRYHIGFKSWELFLVQNNIWQQVGSSIPDTIISGESRRMTVVVDTNVRAYVDGILKFSSATNVTNPDNRVGIRFTGPESGVGITSFEAFDHLAAAITGNLAVTEPRDAFLAISGQVLSGSMAVTESGPDTIVANGVVTSAVFVMDSFNDTAGKELSQHPPDFGGSWVQHPATPSAVFHLDASGTRLQKQNVTATSLYYNTALPSSGEYEVEARIVKVSGSTEAGAHGICARVQPIDNTFYMFRYHAANQGFELWSFNNGVATQHGGVFSDPLLAGMQRLMRMALSDESGQCRIKCYVDEVERFNVLMSVANSFPIGFAGLRGFGLTAGCHLDDYRARGIGLPAGNLIATEPADIAAVSSTAEWQLTMAATEPFDIAFFGDMSGSMAVTEPFDIAAFSGFGTAEGDLFSYPDIFTIPDIFFAASLIVKGDLAVIEPLDVAAFAAPVIIKGTLAAFEVVTDICLFDVAIVGEGTMAAIEPLDGDLANFKASIAIVGNMAAVEPRDKAFMTNWKPGDGDVVISLIGRDLSIQHLTGFGGGFSG